MNTPRLIFLLALLILAPSRALGAERDFSAGAWFRAALTIEGLREVPFFLWLPEEDAKPAVIRNGAEDIDVIFERVGAGFVLDFPHYDSRITAAYQDGVYRGEWRKQREDGVAVMPFRASEISEPGGFQRFDTTLIRRDMPRPLGLPETRWKIEFSESGAAVGRFAPVFGQPGALHVVHGTIETTTGDYRFLEGVETLAGPGADRGLTLSVFDGAHAFLIVGNADSAGARMSGDFYSGNWFHETFTAMRLADDDNYTLPDPFSEVALTTGDGRLRIAALDTPRYRGRPVIVQIFGTWCPNCHDETPMLVDLHRRYSGAGIEVFGLAYEVTGDDARSRRQVQRFIEKYNIPWEIVIAGTSDKEQASSTLPDISRVKSFPTTIWIGRDGVVRAIHSGFAGPATGDEHTRLIAEFDRLTREIAAQP